jgi:hypothetical protein
MMKNIVSKLFYIIVCFTVLWASVPIAALATSTANSGQGEVSFTMAPAPPPGFNPLTASNSDLQKYGFPLNPGADARAQEMWKKAVLAPRVKAALGPVKYRIEHRNLATKQISKQEISNLGVPSASTVAPSSATYWDSPTWCGVESAQYYTRVIGWWMFPWAYADQQHRPSYESSWVGLGGDESNGSNTVVQGVSQSFVNADGSGYYGLVAEIYNNGQDWQQAVPGISYQPGDLIYCDVSVSYTVVGGVPVCDAYYYFYDDATNQAAGIYGTCANYSNVSSSAEWISERPGGDNTQYLDCYNDRCHSGYNAEDFNMCEAGSTQGVSYPNPNDASTHYLFAINPYPGTPPYHYINETGTIDTNGNFCTAWQSYN